MTERATRGLRLLFLAPFAPRLDGTHGGSRSIAQRIAALGARHRVAVLYLRGGDEPAMDDALRALCDRVEEVPRAGGRWRQRAVRAMALLRGEPRWAAQWAVPALARRAASVAASWRPDVVHFDFHLMAQYAGAFDGCHAARVLVDHEPGAAAARAAARRRRGPARAVALLDARAWRRYERRVMRRMQAVVVFTERDERALAPLAGATPLVRVPLSAPARAHPLDPLGHAPPAILFVGSFIHPPNVDAAMRLVADVFPRVRARHPEARLWIVGDQPPPALRAAADDRVVVTGRVPDVTPYLDGAAVVVAPLREGGGMRVKVLEALGAGKALVATPLAASGMGLTAGEHALLVETDEEIAEAIAELVEHPARRAALGAAAFAWAHAHLGDDALVAAFEALYARLGHDAGPPAPVARELAPPAGHAATEGRR